jgi:glycosyltransferase involved in cell wall biosynthesis
MIEVSVIVPAFQAEASVAMAIGSLAAQELRAWECIAVDDGSRDGTGAILARLAAREPRLRVVSLGKNFGRGYARAAGLAQAKGRYVAFLDADDWCYPERLALQVAFLEREPDCGLVSSGMAIVGADGSLSGVRADGTGLVDRRARASGFVVPAGVWFGPSLVRAELARRIGFGPDLRYAEDFDFLGRLGAVCDTAVLGEPLYVYSKLASLNRKKILAVLAEVDAVLRTAGGRPGTWRLRRRASVRAKALAYDALFRAGLGKIALRHRAREASPGEARRFERARAAAVAALRRLQGVAA